MAKILKFPTKEKIKIDQEIKAINALNDECVEISKFLMDVLEEFICTGSASDLDQFMDMNFRDESYQESRDMFVIVNMINAMLNRHAGIPHALHRTMDRAYIEIKRIIEMNERARMELQGIVFPPLEEEDDTD